METIKALRWLCLNIEWRREKSEKVWSVGENGKFLYGVTKIHFNKKNAVTRWTTRSYGRGRGRGP